MKENSQKGQLRPRENSYPCGGSYTTPAPGILENPSLYFFYSPSKGVIPLPRFPTGILIGRESCHPNATLICKNGELILGVSARFKE